VKRVDPDRVAGIDPFMGFEFVDQRTVEFSETDMAGIVHFANFFRWMESAEHAFLRSLGFSVHASRDGGTTGWPRVKVSCEYLQPLRFEDEVETVLSIKEVRTRSVCYVFEFRHVVEKGGNGVVARGEVVAVHAGVNALTGELQAGPIPENLKALLLERVSA
jgi:YbgC/YbaW family acyl-CoA thioester hydrolase